MNTEHEPLIVGLGSSHGDDQAGWLVIYGLQLRGAAGDQARTARQPADLSDWFQPDRPLILCDACLGPDPAGTIRQWIWPAQTLPATRGGTHDLGLGDVLELGRQLAVLPDHVELWTIAGREFGAAQEPCDEVVQAADELAELLWRTKPSAASQGNVHTRYR